MDAVANGEQLFYFALSFFDGAAWATRVIRLLETTA